MLLRKNKSKLSGLFLSIFLITAGCEREVSDDVVPAEFPNTPDVFNDSPVGMGTDFYFPFEGSKATAWTVDEEESFQGTASMRFDVPNANDPEGSFAGAIFRIDGAGRNLTGYDALTFWARASRGVTIGVFGFGEDFIENKYRTTRTNVSLSTAWKKIIIPLPDPSKFVEERGMFRYAAGTQDTNGSAYSFWVDELRFEELGTIAQPRPAIQNGQDEVVQNFIGGNISVTGLTQTFNTASGNDVTTLIEPAFFQFTSSNESVATVDENGNVSITGSGTSTITATLNGVDAEGSLIIESLGEFTPAPVPDRDPEKVISIFSDAYDNVPVDYYNGFFNADGQTTQGGTGPGGADISVNDDGIINYTQLNFVGIGTFDEVSPVNATGMTHIHVDINVNENIDPGDYINFQLINDVGGDESSGTITFSADELATNEWRSFDIPLSDFSGLESRSQLGLIFFISDATIGNIYVDNIYYYQDVPDAQPNVDDTDATEFSLPVGFESSTLNYDITGFEQANALVSNNDFTDGTNPTSNALQVVKTSGSAFFAGAFMDLETPIDLSDEQVINLKVYSPKANIPIRMALESAGGGNQVTVDVNAYSSDEWIELEFNFSEVIDPNIDYQRIVLIPEFIDGIPGDGSTYYFDDIQIIE
jgi:hypothetical protein